jgi:hypothetical protein
MSFGAVVVDPLEEALPAAWDGLTTAAGLSSLWRSGVLSSVAWYERYRPIMALAHDASGEPCAAFCARHLSVPAGRRSFHDPGRRPLVGFLEFHLPPGITTAGYAFHPDLDARERSAVVAAVERALGARLGPGCRGFAYRQVAAGDLAAFDRGPRAVLNASPEAVLENEWEGVDAYLAARRSEDRRELLRVRRLIDGDATLKVSTDGSVAAAEAGRLAHVVRMRYRGRFQIAAPLPSAYFDWLGRLDGVRFITYRDASDELLGYGALVDDGAAVRSLLWGTRERADRGRPNLYFDHFLREVEYCIANGRRRLVLGKAMADIKARFGARPVDLYTVARVRSALPMWRAA